MLAVPHIARISGLFSRLEVPWLDSASELRFEAAKAPEMYSRRAKRSNKSCKILMVSVERLALFRGRCVSALGFSRLVCFCEEEKVSHSQY